MDTDKFYHACSVLVGKLPRFGWSLTGGASLFARGLLQNANDIDVLATRDCAEAAALSLAEFSLRELSRSQNGDVKSLFADYTILGFRTEIMAEVYNRSKDNVWCAHKEWENHVEFVRLKSLTIPMLTLQYEANVAQMLSNDDRTALILNALKDAEQVAIPGFRNMGMTSCRQMLSLPVK